MSCIPCNLTKSIPVCTESLTIGEVEISTSYDVYLTNNNTGYTIKLAVTSSGAGLLVVDLSQIEPSFFSPFHKYKIQAVESGDSIDKVVTIVMPNETEVTCLLVPFTRVFSGSGTVEGQAAAVLELDLSCECE